VLEDMANENRGSWIVISLAWRRHDGRLGVAFEILISVAVDQD